MPFRIQGFAGVTAILQKNKSSVDFSVAISIGNEQILEINAFGYVNEKSVHLPETDSLYMFNGVLEKGIIKMEHFLRLPEEAGAAGPPCFVNLSGTHISGTLRTASELDAVSYAKLEQSGSAAIAGTSSSPKKAFFSKSPKKAPVIKGPVVATTNSKRPADLDDDFDRIYDDPEPLESEALESSESTSPSTSAAGNTEDSTPPTSPTRNNPDVPSTEKVDQQKKRKTSSV